MYRDPKKQFTFQYVSILMILFDQITLAVNLFTFQYVSILIKMLSVRCALQFDLHSNMFLF